MTYVALLAEGVDRNLINFDTVTSVAMSPSSQRAWIEMRSARTSSMRRRVALLAEGVDRNRFAEEDERRELDVALLAEGVDRNLLERLGTHDAGCRPPRRGRG